MTPFRILFLAFLVSETHGFLLQQPESDSYAFRIDRGPTSDLNKTYNLKLQREVKSLSAFCFGRRSDAFCTYQCRKVAQISTHRICEDSWFLSEAYEELEPCDHFEAGACRWFRCQCLPLSEPNATQVTDTKVALGFCKKTLLRYGDETFMKLLENFGDGSRIEYLYTQGPTVILSYKEKLRMNL